MDELQDYGWVCYSPELLRMNLSLSALCINLSWYVGSKEPNFELSKIPLLDSLDLIVYVSWEKSCLSPV